MLVVVSPAKSLDYESKLPTKKFSEPEFLDRSTKLIEVMRTKTPRELSAMMSISDDLAELNVERFNDWSTPFTPANARPAAFAFAGDTYLGLDAYSFDARDLTQAQKVLRILSGLYGVLRPLDLIQPYRLEMGTTVDNPGGKNLYEFWDTTITDAINQAVAASPGTQALINCASNEYFSAVDSKRLDAHLITPKFLDQPLNGTPGDYKVIGFHAKRARGAMARWIIQNRITAMSAITEFAEHGYRHDPGRSTPTAPAFIRSV